MTYVYTVVVLLLINTYYSNNSIIENLEKPNAVNIVTPVPPRLYILNKIIYCVLNHLCELIFFHWF